MWITYDPNAPFPQVPRFEGVLDKPRKRHDPPDGLASFEADLGKELTREEVSAFYEVTAADTITRKAQSVIDALKLEDAKSRALVNTRAMANAHITATWPLWRQMNADAGLYPAEVKTQKDDDVAAVITESNRVEDEIDAATTIEEVDAAVASINWPTLGN